MTDHESLVTVNFRIIGPGIDYAQSSLWGEVRRASKKKSERKGEKDVRALPGVLGMRH